MVRCGREVRGVRTAARRHDTITTETFDQLRVIASESGGSTPFLSLQVPNARLAAGSRQRDLDAIELVRLDRIGVDDRDLAAIGGRAGIPDKL